LISSHNNSSKSGGKKFLFQQLNHFVPIAQSCSEQKRYQISGFAAKEINGRVKKVPVGCVSPLPTVPLPVPRTWFTVIPFSSPLKDTPQV
jgi:hypothetical protein